MALRYIPTGATAATTGGMLITGLSTDIKPVSPLAPWSFFEVDTCKIFIVSGGVWTQQNIKPGYTLSVQALTSSPADAATIFFGSLPKAPVTTGGTSKIVIQKAGAIKAASVYCFSGTAGTAEAWQMFIRKNNTTDTLIQSLSLATQERSFVNAALNIPVIVGDYIEIKLINPTWVTNPLTTIFGGSVYIE